MMAHRENDEAPRLPGHRLRQIGVAADVHPRTVARVLSGAPTRGMQRDRVERALREAGLEHLIPRGGAR
jgi:hypothetical protein